MPERARDEIVLYMHAGSGNHGCEAIVNSLCHMIHAKVAVLSYRADEDRQYSLKDLCTIEQENRFSEHKLAHVICMAWRWVFGDTECPIRYRFRPVFGKGQSKLAVSIGGDNYCYANMINDLIRSNSAFNQLGTRTVLLGASFDEEVLKKKWIPRDLYTYQLIIVRETLSLRALHTIDVDRSRVRMYPDPAFTLGKIELPLPEGFVEGNTIGINMSPMIQENETVPGMAMENYRNLIRHIIDTTDQQIALIPHVVWEQNDDRIPLRSLYQEFQDTGRLVMIEDHSAEELKGYISRCSLLVAARTHACIAAYSSCVPTLALGYSIKAKGIARDLFGSYEHYVVPVQTLQEPDQLSKEFDWLIKNARQVGRILRDVMPDYQKKALESGKEIDRIWEELNRPRKTSRLGI